MSDFSVKFAHPWLLLILIPALFLAFFPYFRISKKYRRTRNRICSLVLHTIVLVLSISLLAGTTFNYSVPNKDNELLLLVDVSDTEEESADRRDEFVKTVLDGAKFDNYKACVVTFGFDQVLAVPFTYKVDEIYDGYLSAAKPDVSATNVAAALDYAKTLFSNPSGAKIVLISDGKETDENALSVIRGISAQGIKVDTALIPSDYTDGDVLISGITLPETRIKAGEECDITVSLKTQLKDGVSISGVVSLYDNGNEISDISQVVELTAGERTLTFKYKFKSLSETEGNGFHEIKFGFSGSGDAMDINNEYRTYVNIEEYNKVLVLSGGGSSPDAILSVLDTPEYKTTADGGEVSTVVALDVNDTVNEKYPKTVDALRDYDQIILNNVAYKDMPSAKTEGFSEDFEKMLYSYVYDYGGGLFTVGGNEKDDDTTAHAYNRQDVRNSTYFKQLLPVDVITYTPPVGVTIIVDRSGSMSGTGSDSVTFLERAKAGATYALSALTERDYVSIMTLDSYAATILPLTPMTKRAKIEEAIDSIGDATGGTIYQDALDTAGGALVSLSAVEKRHIIVITDGQPNESPESYEGIIKGYYNEGKGNCVTLSVFAFGQERPANADALDQKDYEELGTTSYEIMLRMAKLGGGKLYVFSRESGDKIVEKMKEDLTSPEMKEVEAKKFFPTVNNIASPLAKGLITGKGDALKVSLGGFYGVKAKKNSNVVLSGDYSVPVYVQWKYGKGSVGSFMSDLNGNWSRDFLSGTDFEGNPDLSGVTFIRNVISNLMPVENIRPNDISINLKEDNYTNTVSVYAGLKDGESVTGRISALSSAEESGVSLNSVGGNDDLFVKTALDETNNYSRCAFVVKKAGVYKITLVKNYADGTTREFVAYKTFSYSEEYDFTVKNGEKTKNYMQTIADGGNGYMVEDLEDPSEIFASFVTDIARTFDPRWLFAIIAIIAFLLDIAVRKFKFKWLHEIIREKKEKKNEK